MPKIIVIGHLLFKLL